MREEEFKLGTQFTYEGDEWPSEKGITQTVTKINNHHIYTDLPANSSNGISFGSNYINDCVFVSTLLSNSDYKVIEIQKVIK